MKDFEDINDYTSVTITVASPSEIRKWSSGEVTKPETINYRTHRPEKDGLFCERIFGPERDWECFCGKYKGIKHKGVLCDRCGVKIALSKERRSRMGHINLASPVIHIWFFKSLPNRLATLLGVPPKALERVIYYQDYIVTDPGKTPLDPRQLLTEEEYRAARDNYGSGFKADMGADGIRTLLKKINVHELSEEIGVALGTTRSEQKKKQLAKQLKLVEDIKKSGTKPDWIILEVVPVIPPDLRPLVLLESGNFATSDLNDLYRRVINRNNRLKKLLELRAPEVIIRNEKRMLQQVVDALFDNGRCKRPIMSSGNRQLKSLTDMIKGKQGRFRENLLGKRVDYSARSVIVVGPELKLHQCGLPKYIALELFQPFIIRRLREMGMADTIKSAKKMLDRRDDKIWDILDEVIRKHPVMLNRAPTLHRMGIQAFEPVLVEGNAIKIHPLVCAGFNADFDGDTMSVHLPLTVEAQAEARMLMMSTRNILSPAHGKPIIGPSQDIVLGLYYLTLLGKDEAGEGKLFSGFTEVLRAHADGKVGIHAAVGVRILERKIVGEEGDESDGIVRTTAGRVIFNDILPEGMPFYNKVLDKGALNNIIHDCYELKGANETIELLDGIKTLGFTSATRSGLSFAATDLKIPEKKAGILNDAEETVGKIERAYRNGVITEGERHNQILDAWTHATEVLGEELMKTLETDTREDESYLNPVYLMAASGARGGMQQLRQLAGMRGLMTKPSGEIIETPIRSNFREGIGVLDYFSSTHGARKGLADTALKTADSGYLTRKLIDVSQNVVVCIDDCGTLNGITKGVGDIGQSSGLTLKGLISGRTARDTIVDVVTDQVIVKENEQITPEKAISVEKLGYEKVRVRSPLTCEASVGICAKCYGTDLSTGKIAELGLAGGIIAAQSIGEPGTQLTMRTFHIGGTASRALEESDIKAGESGVIGFHNMNIVVNQEGRRVILNRGAELVVLDHRGRELERHTCPVGADVLVQEGESVKKAQLLVQWDPHMFPILTEKAGIVRFEDIVPGETVSEEIDKGSSVVRLVVVEHKGDLHPQLVIEDEDGSKLGVYPIPEKAVIEVQDGKDVAAGTMLAKTPREIRGTQDITGGLPRVTELFEARKPKDPSIMSEIDGVVEIGDRKRGKITLLVRSESGMVAEHLVPRGKHLRVTTGDRVKAGEPLVDGPLVLQDILQINGEEAVQQYLLREIQSVYRSQNVTIDDKHIELIIRRMMSSVQVDDSGDTKLLPNDIVDRGVFQTENEAARKEKKKPAKADPILLGITKAALRSDSFIAAASFQQTTKVLTEAALAGRTDLLQGLKENVILGRLVPVGTGFRRYWEADLKIPGLEDLLGGPSDDEDSEDSDVKEEVA